MGALRQLSEGLLDGTLRTEEHHPFTPRLELEEVGAGVAFVSGFANVVAVRAGDELLLVDCGGALLAGPVHGLVRGYSAAPLSTVIFTHGHIDHVCGLGPFLAERGAAADPAGGDGATAPPLRVVAHEAVPARFDRYRMTGGYNSCVNTRQFGLPVTWPTDYRYPDLTYRDQLVLGVSGLRLELRHDRGETDDHTWVWLPGPAVLCTGDLFIWATPNAGNPQKVQRYPREWAAALRRMAALPAEVLCPGHGPPIFGAAQVHLALTETAELLESLVEQTLRLLNEGARLDDILHTVRPPAHLLARPYLRPVYDEPAFIVRNLYRLYGGWYDGNPAHLKPAPEAALSCELAALCGGAGPLLARAEALQASGEHALACHLAELAAQAAPGDEAVWRTRGEIYRRRATEEADTSLMARGIFTAAANERPPRPAGG